MPAADPVFLAVDLGAESGRVIAGRLSDGNCELDELHRFPNGPISVPNADGSPSLRWDLLALWKEIAAGLAKAGAKYGEAVQSVGVDTWGVDHVLLGPTGEVLGPAWNYRDPRTRGGLAEAFADVPRADLFAGTGVQFLELNSLYQLRATRRDHPALLAAASSLQLIPDYLHRLLCGSAAVEFTNATTTQLVDPRTRDWNRDLIARLGLPVEVFGEIVPPGTDLGPAVPRRRRRRGVAARGPGRGPGDARHRQRGRRRADRADRIGGLGVHLLRDLVAGGGGDGRTGSLRRRAGGERDERGRRRRHNPAAEKRDGAVVGAGRAAVARRGGGGAGLRRPHRPGRGGGAAGQSDRPGRRPVSRPGRHGRRSPRVLPRHRSTRPPPTPGVWFGAAWTASPCGTPRCWTPSPG